MLVTSGNTDHYTTEEELVSLIPVMADLKVETYNTTDNQTHSKLLAKIDNYALGKYSSRAAECGYQWRQKKLASGESSKPRQKDR